LQARVKKQEATEFIIKPGRRRFDGTSSSSRGSYRSSNNNHCREMDYRPEFYGNSRYAETGLYYDISCQVKKLREMLTGTSMASSAELSIQVVLRDGQGRLSMLSHLVWTGSLGKARVWHSVGDVESLVKF
jgi:hypothetical protein